jgi:hypothetical protein
MAKHEYNKYLNDKSYPITDERINIKNLGIGTRIDIDAGSVEPKTISVL